MLGAARIVPAALVRPARVVPAAQVVAIAARDPARARAFAAKHGIPRVHASYDALLADPEIEAVYIPLPNGLHAEWTVRALRAGKHVLCEKPFAANATEAERMAATAEESGRLLMEAAHSRHHPIADRLKAILDGGELGTVRHFEATLCFPLVRPRDIRWQYALAGGATMDAGCYPIQLLRFLAGAEPEVTAAHARLLYPQVDRYMRADLRFPDGRTGRMVCSMLSPILFSARLRVRGDAGELRVLNPYLPHLYHRIQVRTRGGTRRERVPGAPTYVYQLRNFIRAVRGEGPNLTDAANATATMRVIDAIYTRAGLKLRGT